MKAKKALEETAKAYHVSVSEVYREIDFCISEAMKNPDPKVQEEWRKIPCKGAAPTQEELLDYLKKGVTGAI